jgi:hypothetical protein
VRVLIAGAGGTIGEATRDPQMTDHDSLITALRGGDAGERELAASELFAEPDPRAEEPLLEALYDRPDRPCRACSSSPRTRIGSFASRH